jgi:hypothetical protein
VILEGAIDPNVGRHALTERVAYGTVDPNLTNDGELATLSIVCRPRVVSSLSRRE